jgi:hypothetical protein
LYSRGQGVDTNPKKAAELWLQVAIAHKLPESMRHLGEAFATGSGVAKNDQQAMMWYRRAADRGDDDARMAVQRMIDAGRATAAEP